MNDNPKRLILGISGASGIVYGIRLLEFLRKLDIESHLVMSKAAAVTAGIETKLKISEIRFNLLKDNQYTPFLHHDKRCFHPRELVEPRF